MALRPADNGTGHMERRRGGVHARNDEVSLFPGGLGALVHHALQKGHVLLRDLSRQPGRTLLVAGQFRPQGEQPALDAVNRGADIFPVGLGIRQPQHGVGLVNGAVALHPQAGLAHPGAAYQASLALVSGFGVKIRHQPTSTVSTMPTMEVSTGASPLPNT